MAPKNDFGRYIRRQRVAAGLSLRKAADRLGMTHVYLGEVERGVRPPLAEKWWPDLMRIIPTIDKEELERTVATSRPIQLHLARVKPAYQDLGRMLARRIKKEDLSKRDLGEFLRVLRGYEDE